MTELRKDWNFKDFISDPWVINSIGKIDIEFLGTTQLSDHKYERFFWELIAVVEEFIQELSSYDYSLSQIYYYSCFSKKEADTLKAKRAFEKFVTKKEEGSNGIDRPIGRTIREWLSDWKAKEFFPQRNTKTSKVILVFLNKNEILHQLKGKPASKSLGKNDELQNFNGYWAAYFLDSNETGKDPMVQRNLIRFDFSLNGNHQIEYFSLDKRKWILDSNEDINFSFEQQTPTFEINLRHINNLINKLHVRFLARPDAELIIGIYDSFSHSNGGRPSTGYEVLRKLNCIPEEGIDKFIKKFPLFRALGLEPNEELIFEFLKINQPKRIISPSNCESFSNLSSWISKLKIEIVENAIYSLRQNYFEVIAYGLLSHHKEWLENIFNTIQSPLGLSEDRSPYVARTDKMNSKLVFKVNHYFEIQDFYRRMVRKDKNEEYWITTSPSETYIWKDQGDEIVREISKNLKASRSKMYRFFIIPREKTKNINLNTQDKAVLRLQLMDTLSKEGKKIIHHHWESYGQNSESEIFLTPEELLNQDYDNHFFGLTKNSNLYWRFDFNPESKPCPVTHITCRPATEEEKKGKDQLFSISVSYLGK